MTGPIDTVLDTLPPSAAADVVRRWFTALEVQDLAELGALMARDVVIELPFSESGRTDPGHFRVYDGHAACVEFWTVAFEAEGDGGPLLDPEVTVSADGTTVFVEGRGDITMASGRRYRNRYVMRMVLRDGLVAHVREYYNPIVSAYAFGRPVAGQILLESL
ncbi:nuclear transport factor 2 family protein [Nocardioides sp.]|uniref:nuclear transport factor 2 family protein n=1 Tax=Nocardioides sp. TaxID=35761 RepID=UPI00262619B0|nr:nuclear transport factor 2 family protein [Nocardioides sp.]